MANVLPLDERREIYSAYKKRVLILSLLVFSALVLLASIMLIPSLIIFSVKKEAISKQLEFLRESDQVRVTGEALDEIKLTRERMKVITPNTNVSMSSRIEEITSVRPSGVLVKSIIIPSPTLVEIRGEGSTRESILAYAKALEASKFVEKVDSPISNLINGEGSPFVIRITTKEKI